MRWIWIGCVGIVMSVSVSMSYGQARDLPYFEPIECADPQQYDECGYLHVPENRTQQNSDTIQLYVKISRASSRDVLPDPIVFLNGGPGSRTIEFEDTLLGFGVLNITRDVIFFDQRGVGLSQPALDCVNFQSVIASLLSLDLQMIERNKRLYSAHVECQRLLTSRGIDLSAYNTVQNAADVEDLRIALGYDEWNLYGISYGTLLALNVLRDYPEHVRSAVLMSVVPPQVNWITDRAENADRAFDLFFQTCEENLSCNRNYPHLRADFYRMVAQLNAIPVEIDLGSSLPVVIRGDDYLNLLLSSLYNPSLLIFMPSIIGRALQGDHQLMAIFVDGQQYQNTVLSMGMYHTTICADTIRDQTYTRLAEPDNRFLAFGNLFDAGHWHDLCAIWDITPSDPIYQTPVVSDVPVLMLSGRLDPITPPRYGDLALETLSNAYHYVLPYSGHSLHADRCGRLIARDFIDTPTAAPDTSCIEIQPILRFRELPE
ncbi:MAG: alpha/beta hydrolase [Anaerolineae bacterium]|nr:alpha/beta hydrolase [Anaerolineae bacterium]